LEQLQNIISQLSPVPGSGAIDAAALLQAHAETAVTSIRYNPRKPVQEHFAAEQVPWCPEGRYLQERPVFTLDPLFHAGAYYVQEASSMFVYQAVKARMAAGAPIRALDLCAAPGGKSSLLATLLRDEDLLVANEVIQNRAGILAENLTRWGQMNTWVTNNDPRDFAKIPGYFDVILVDAPCTGSGLWRKDPEALQEWSTEHVKLCSERQRRILSDISPALKSGGLLIYATCSYSVEEDEQVCDWLLSTEAFVPLEIPLEEDWNIVASQSPMHSASGYRFYPWKLKGEGFFLAAFQKKSDSIELLPEREKKSKKKGTSAQPARRKDQVPDWSRFLDTSFIAIERGDLSCAIHPDHLADYEYLQPAVRWKKVGTALGKMAGRDHLPDHELALSVHLSANLPSVSVDHEEALHFLKKEEIKRDLGLKGWHVLRHQGLALGWGKWMPGRMNNYLPKNLRIRMDLR
jgi:16S rRNA C967 or C1407 C5-methylase (RsmB/RsmF family)/NOL1/NOP2/fmu family ribosome biogenesis protein